MSSIIAQVAVPLESASVVVETSVPGSGPLVAVVECSIPGSAILETAVLLVGLSSLLLNSTDSGQCLLQEGVLCWC